MLCARGPSRAAHSSTTNRRSARASRLRGRGAAVFAADGVQQPQFRRVRTESFLALQFTIASANEARRRRQEHALRWRTMGEPRHFDPKHIVGQPCRTQNTRCHFTPALVGICGDRVDRNRGAVRCLKPSVRQIARILNEDLQFRGTVVTDLGDHLFEHLDPR